MGSRRLGVGRELLRMSCRFVEVWMGMGMDMCMRLALGGVPWLNANFAGDARKM